MCFYSIANGKDQLKCVRCSHRLFLNGSNRYEFHKSLIAVPFPVRSSSFSHSNDFFLGSFHGWVSADPHIKKITILNHVMPKVNQNTNLHSSSDDWKHEWVLWFSSWKEKGNTTIHSRLVSLCQRKLEPECQIMSQLHLLAPPTNQHNSDSNPMNVFSTNNNSCP